MIILEKIREYFQNNYPSLIANAIVNTIILILSVFIGAYLALQNSNDTNKEIKITDLNKSWQRFIKQNYY